MPKISGVDHVTITPEQAQFLEDHPEALSLIMKVHSQALADGWAQGMEEQTDFAHSLPAEPAKTSVPSYQDASDIVNMCQLVGRPELAATFIQKQMSADAVRQALEVIREQTAADQDISSARGIQGAEDARDAKLAHEVIDVDAIYARRKAHLLTKAGYR